jgi:hypothetical protein
MHFEFSSAAQRTKKIITRRQGLLALAFASLLTIPLVGCISAPIAGNSSTPPPVAAAAHLEVTPSTISFGSAVVGVLNSQTLKLTNNGGTAMTVTGIVANGAGLSINGFSGSTLLNPGTSASFGVELTAKTSGAFSGSVAILSKTSSLDTTLPVTGTVEAAKAEIAVGATSLNFGTVNSGKTASQSVTVSNTGNVSVTISKVALTGAGFSISSGSVPVQLASAQNVTFDLEFTPKASGTTNGTLTVDSNASDSSLVVKLTGAETAPSSGNPPSSNAQHYVGLTWDASSSSGITGYNVYRGGSESGPFSRLNGSLVNELKYTDDSVTAGDTYYYVTTAVNSKGEESPYSNWAKAVIP